MSERIPDKLHGRFFAPKTSASLDATLEDRGDALAVIVDGETEETLVEFKELGDRLGNLPRKIYFTDGSAFECADNDAVDLAFGKQKSFFTKLSKAEGSYKFAICAFLLTVLSVIGFYTHGLPALASFASWATPSPAVAAIDRNALRTVDRFLFETSTMSGEDKQKYTEIFNELVEASDAGKQKFQLLFRDGGRLGPNAVALPGGTIILTDQLAELSENDDEVAGVLAHEIGHVLERHSLRQIYRALGIAFMAAIIIGDSSQLLDNVVAQVAALDTFRYSRQFELEADSASVEIMTKIGRDPEAFINLLDRIFASVGADGNSESWLSTHPGNENRRENVQQQIEQLAQ